MKTSESARDNHLEPVKYQQEYSWLLQMTQLSFRCQYITSEQQKTFLKTERATDLPPHKALEAETKI